MQKLRSILFVSQGVTDEIDALKQAFTLASSNKAELKALIVCPELPKEMTDYKKNYETSLIDHLQKSIQISRDSTKVSEKDVPVLIEIESGSTPTVRIIRHVLKNGHDLVMKETEPKEGGKGFKSIDMELLRKCPCPVWLCRPISKHRNLVEVAVAIDPKNIEPEAYDLSVRLLKLSRSLADACNGELNIISCWDYEFEEYLRRNVWTNVKDHKLIKTVSGVQNQDLTALEHLIQKSGISGKIQIHHLRGHPDQMIPQCIFDRNIDILVMGTVARTGIPGFLIGNTAENIVQKLQCTLLALKPKGFVSSVKPY